MKKTMGSIINPIPVIMFSLSATGKGDVINFKVVKNACQCIRM